MAKFNLHTAQFEPIDQPDNIVYEIEFVGENVYISGT
jgi:hypothetical protein